ncbi:hypothetical protein DFH11DRAFT_1547986 [Phellopilus nigrolimitatus]|nr:hypothetical protein DFH11DRAFT_1547986 [Phellopilus nigrolimitatus]
MRLIRSDVEPVDPSLVPLLISEIDIERYIHVAILTLLVYDTFITMDKENRYIGIIGALSSILVPFKQMKLCSLLIILKGLGFFWIANLADILLMRVLALYHQDKRLAACLRTLFGLEAAFGLGILIYSNIYEELVVGEISKDVTVCGTNRDPSKVWSALSWAAPMLYAIILMVLALYKAAEHWRETAGFSQFTLVKIVSEQLYIQDILLAYLLNLLGNPSLLCVLGCHLLVHLKEAGKRGVNVGTSFRMKTMSNIEFS